MAKPGWLTVNPMSGSGNKTLNNSASAHTGRVARVGTVTITGKDIAEAVTYRVTQSPLAEYVQFTDGSSMSVEKAGGKITIAGKSNSQKLTFSWVGSVADVNIPSSYTAAGAVTTNGEAIADDPGASAEYDFSIQLELPENDTVSAISRVLKVTADGSQYAQISIDQAAGDPTLSINVTEITIPQDGSTVTVNVESNTSWTVA